MKTIIQKCAWRTDTNDIGRLVRVVDDVCASKDGFGTFTLDSYRERNLAKQAYIEGKSLEIGESRMFEHVGSGPWGPISSKHTITRTASNVVTMINNGAFGGNLGAYVISPSRYSLTKYVDKRYIPVIYRGLIRALLGVD